MSGRDNPPAFPRDERYLGHNGMDLRDWFAGQELPPSLTASLAAADAKGLNLSIAAKAAAGMAYQVADALLAARQQEQSHEA